MSVSEHMQVTRGRWLNASNGMIWTANGVRGAGTFGHLDIRGRRYPSGFHIFVNQADAESEGITVVEVRYRRVVAEGTQSVVDFRKKPRARVAPVVVAKQMYVPRCSRSARR